MYFNALIFPQNGLKIVKNQCIDFQIPHSVQEQWDLVPLDYLLLPWSNSGRLVEGIFSDQCQGFSKGKWYRIRLSLFFLSVQSVGYIYIFIPWGLVIIPRVKVNSFPMIFLILLKGWFWSSIFKLSF